MNRNKILIATIVVAALLSVVGVGTQTGFLNGTLTNAYVYVPSDITKANPNIKVSVGDVSMESDITQFKKTVLLTLEGTITNIDDPIAWTDETGQEHGAIPITMKVEKNTKINKETNERIEKGDTFTFYLDGLYHQGDYYLWNFEPQFEIGERSIVHLGKGYQGPLGENGDNYFVELGLYGKYKVVDDKAYNEKFPNGKSVNLALTETQ